VRLKGRYVTQQIERRGAKYRGWGGFKTWGTFAIKKGKEKKGKRECENLKREKTGRVQTRHKKKKKKKGT